MNERSRPVIVFGDDESPGADICWLWINVHEWPAWRLEVVTALPPPAGPPVSTARSTPHAWQPTHPRRPFPQAGFAEFEQLVCEKDPRLALMRPTDLLVIGSTGPGFVKALHLGSTCEWLSHHPPAPMVVVRHGHTTRSVVVCTDGSPASVAAITALCAMPWVKSLDITVATVADGRADVDRAAECALEALRAAGVAAEHVPLEGEPTGVLVDYLEAAEPDLVVLGTRGLTGLARVRSLQRMRRGSTANALLHALAASNVLVACAAPPD